MAASVSARTGRVCEEPRILVQVDHASEDLLVVSYPYRSRLFQGVLLDATNRYLPCAHPGPEVVKWSPPRVVDVPVGEPADRAFYSLSNRFTYFQDVLFQKNVALVKSAKQAKAKAQKMTVRLRPRQVLCSKCRSICNENSENVRSPGAAKKEERPDKETDENRNDDVKSPRKKVRTTLVPKLSRLDQDDARSLNGGPGEGGRAWSEMLEAEKQMVLRKKRSVGSMEDLWDETVFEEASKKAKTTPVIKISFGSPGEGTVLKIPSKVRLSGSEGEEEEDKGASESSKSLKKALKKAKKEAKRKISPEREEDPSPEEPNYKKHRHRVKHKKRHKNSKEEEMKDKCLKQKLSISLRRVCGPGEEESWSGESSRSSEPLQDSLPDLPPDDTPPQPPSTHNPKRNRRVGAQKRKKTESSQALDPQSTPHQPLQRLPTEPAQTSTHVSVTSNRARPEPASSDRNAQTPLHSDKPPDQTLEAQSSLCLAISSTTQPSDDNIHSDTCASNQQHILPTKELAAEQASLLIEKDRLEVPPSLPEPVESRAEPGRCISPSLLSDSGNFSCVKPDERCIDITFKIDDSLDDNLISEDSMPELDETVEDALLESDKELPEVLENQRSESLTDTWESEREIPVLTRMVDLHQLTCSNDTSVHLPQPGPLKLKQMEQPTLEKSEQNTDTDSSKQLSPLEHHIQNKDDKLSLSHHLSLSLASDPSQNTQNRSPLREVVDSSEESEFLPAEDYFDDTLDGEIPLCPKEITSKNDSTSFEVDKKRVVSSKPKTFEDCLLPKTSLDFELGCYALDSGESALKTSSVEAERSESSVDLGDLSTGLRPLAKCKDGCEISKGGDVTAGRHVEGSLGPDPPPEVSSCCPLQIRPPPTISPTAQALSSPPSDQAEDDRLPVYKSNTTLSSKSKCDKISSSRISRLKYVLPERPDLVCSSVDIAPSFPESSVEATSLEVTLSGEQSKGGPKYPLPDRGSDAIDTTTLSPSDSVPDFPESSSQGAPQEVTSCQTSDGFELSVGDIVWAKIHGFPWWPAKVTRLCAGRNGCDARVAWFGSSTSSLLSTDQLSPFIQTFKAKYSEERKCSGYLEAVRQATSAASSQHLHLDLDKLLPL